MDAQTRSVSPPTLRSLSEQLVDLRARLDNPPQEFDQGRIYDQLHLLIFGTRSRRKRTSLRNSVILGRLYSWCLDRGVDFPTYVSAQMTLCRGGARAFRVNYLWGERAERRYNGYLRRANSRYRKGSREAFVGTETWVGRVRHELALSEAEVADIYVHACLAGHEIEWDEAVAAANVSDTWRRFVRKRGDWLRFADLFGEDRANGEGDLMRLAAAWQVAEGIRHGLPDCIGVTDFSWSAFAALMVQLFGVHHQHEEGAPQVAKHRTWQPGESYVG